MAYIATTQFTNDSCRMTSVSEGIQLTLNTAVTWFSIFKVRLFLKFQCSKILNTLHLEFFQFPSVIFETIRVKFQILKFQMLSNFSLRI